MIRKGYQYLDINRILLLVIGLWPYQQSNFTRFQFIFISTILTTIIIFQLATFLTFSCTSEHLVKVLSSASLFTAAIIKYNSFRFNIEDVKYLLMQTQLIYNKLKDKNEIAIVKKYDCIAKRYTIVIATSGVCFVFAFIIAQLWINMADVNLPTNVSRSFHFLLETEYFVNQEKYFHFILLHINVAFCFASVVVVAIGTIFITFAQHTCGMLSIASYRIESAININIQQNIKIKNEIWMTKGIIYAVDIHRQAIRLMKHFVSTFEKMFFILVACGVFCLSFNLFQITLIKKDMTFFLPLICVLLCIMYMYISNLQGQIFTDHNNHIFNTACNVQWYRVPLHIQRMILFILQIGTKELILNVGIFDVSMECFATLVKASVSYFTVIYSTQ